MNLKAFIEKHCNPTALEGVVCPYWQGKCDLLTEIGLKRMELCIRLLTSEGINP